MAEASAVIEIVKPYLLAEFPPGEDPDKLTSTTPLVSTGILDPIAMLNLVMFLEKEFGISIEPHEADEEHLDTLEAIQGLVESKK